MSTLITLSFSFVQQGNDSPARTMKNPSAHDLNSRNSFLSLLVGPTKRRIMMKMMNQQQHSFVHAVEHLFSSSDEDTEKYPRVPVHIVLPCINEGAEDDGVLQEEVPDLDNGEVLRYLTSMTTRVEDYGEKETRLITSHDGTSDTNPQMMQIQDHPSASFHLISPHEIQSAIRQGHFHPMDCASCQLELFVVDPWHSPETMSKDVIPDGCYYYLICPHCRAVTRTKRRHDESSWTTMDKEGHSNRSSKSGNCPLASVGFTMSTLQSFLEQEEEERRHHQQRTTRQQEQDEDQQQPR